MHTFGAFALVPIGIALFVAVFFRRIMLGLALGALSSAFLIKNFNIFESLTYFFNNLFLPIIINPDHISIIGFTCIIGALTGVLIKSGATKAFVNFISRVITGRRSAQLLTSLTGLVIFFDDYSNCLIVGSSMHPVCDRYKISRQKLAYIVDSTAAPIACLAFISTWIAFQVSLIDDAFKTSNINLDAYSFFLNSIAYNFYAIFAILAVFIVSGLGRDFGPMLKAEIKALNKKKNYIQKTNYDPDNNNKLLVLFFAPVLALILITLVVLYITGLNATLDPNAPLFEIFGNANSYRAMLVGASIALFIALFLALQQELSDPEELFSGIISGIKEIGSALIILLLAWILGEGLSTMNLGQYLANLLDALIAPALVPTLVFVISALVSFATGTSFGTMAIMVPAALPLIFQISPDVSLYLATTASILGGSVFGDHCSPLSDTTILSSTGSRCDIISHVNTQIPYALLVGLVAIIFGTLPVGFGFSNLVMIPAGILFLVLFFRIFGRRPQDKILASQKEVLTQVGQNI